MKKIILGFVTIILVVSCSKDSRFKTWVGVQVEYQGKTTPIGKPIILESANDSLFEIDFAQDLKSIKRKNNTLLGNGKVKLFSNEFIKSESGDTMRLKSDKGDVVFIEYSKRSKELDVDGLTGLYSYKTGYYIDSISFLNDSMIVYSGNVEQTNYGRIWTMVKYRGCPFILFSDEYNSLTMFSIFERNSNNKDLTLNNLLRNNKIKLIQQKGSFTKQNLFGRWEEIENSIKNKSPVAIKYMNKDPKLKLNISQDIFEINKFEIIRKKKWGVTKDGKRIYFFENFLSKNGVWDIIELNDSIFKAQIGFYGIDDKKEILTFRKSKK